MVDYKSTQIESLGDSLTSSSTQSNFTTGHRSVETPEGRGGVLVFHGHDHIYVQHERDGVVYQLWSKDLDLDNTLIFRTRIDKPGWKARWTTKPDLDVGGAPFR